LGGLPVLRPGDDPFVGGYKLAGRPNAVNIDGCSKAAISITRPFEAQHGEYEREERGRPMGRLVLYMSMSLDGFIGGPDDRMGCRMLT
jgi:hypothetical protein